MTDSSHLPEEMAIANEQALEELAWAIAASVGEFKLILARCNYTSVREQMVQRLQELVSGEIRILTLKESDKALYATIQAFLGSDRPTALIVLGVESVRDVDHMLISANAVREEFRKNFDFPLILWVHDDVIQKLKHLAPDFESWATTTAFAIASNELIQSLRQGAESVFANILSSEGGVIQELSLQLGSLKREEIGAAIQDLQSRGYELEPALKASLDFVRGQNAYARNEIEVALDYYRQSLGFWQQESRGENPDLKLAVAQFHLGLCYFQQGERNPTSENYRCWQDARGYFQRCVDTFEAANRLDLVARFINPLGEVLQRLASWDDLQQVAQKSLGLLQTYPNPVRLAQAYGFLAEGALQSSRWEEAQQNVQKALEAISSVVEVQQGQYQGLYLLLLAESERHLGQQTEAVAHLQQAREIGPQDNPQQYIRILEALRKLYFEQKQYLEAFLIKKQRRSIQQQYGLRAFIGAGRIQPQRQAKLATQVVDARNFASLQETVASEIEASGRQLDVERLIEKLGRPDYKLTVIHGPSGVGKSSLVYGGLVPSLKQRAIGTSDYLSVAMRVYTSWVEELGKQLAEALEEKVETLNFASLQSTETILEQLKQTESHNLRTVLIFDQFEEFFFVCTESAKRQQFFEFLGECLNILSVKVILSLREDYLHYLLECDQLDSMKIIGNDILTKNIRYKLGNFSLADAKSIIQQLTERSHFQLEPALIDELVQDLAGDLNSVRPIELQVVGAQLQTEDITTCAQYREHGPKAELVKRYLAEVVRDCGVENQQAAEVLLYLLTDEKGTRPLRTRAELEQDLQDLFSKDLNSQASKLDLVLKIFVESGLVVLLPENPAERYQLVHDYLAAFIRQQQEPKLNELTAALEKEKAQRQLTEEELKRAEQARQILENANKEAEETNKKASQRIRIGSVVLIVCLVVAGIIGIFASNKLTEAQKGTALERDGSNALKQYELQQIKELLSAMQAGQDLQALVKDNRPLKEYPAASPQLALQTILNNIWEKTQLKGHQAAVKSASFSPDGQHIVTASEDNTAKVWDVSGKLLTTLAGHRDKVWSASFSRDGQRIVTASEDNTAKVWDVSGKLLTTLAGHRSHVNSASFSPSGKQIVTISEDNTAKVWDTSGKLLATLPGYQTPVWSASFSPDEQRIVTTSYDDSGKVWDDHTAKIWDTSGKLLTTLIGHKDSVTSASFSPDSKQIVTASKDKTAKIWNTSGKLLTTLIGHKDSVTSASFSPDSKQIVTASKDKTAKIWNTSGELLATLPGHYDSVTSASFSPDGKQIVTVSKNKTAKVWDDASGKSLADLFGSISSASFSPDSKQIVTAAKENTDNIAQVWSISDHPSAIILAEHKSPVKSASFSPDGKQIVTASVDKTAKVWDASSGKPLLTLRHQDVVKNASFSPDGKQIVTASDDYTARVWQVESLDQLLSRGCTWLHDYLVTHPTDLEKLEVCQNKSIVMAAAPFLVKEGEEQAREKKIDIVSGCAGMI